MTISGKDIPDKGALAPLERERIETQASILLPWFNSSALAPLERERIETVYRVCGGHAFPVLSLRWSERGLKHHLLAERLAPALVLSLRWSERGLKLENSGVNTTYYTCSRSVGARED